MPKRLPDRCAPDSIQEFHAASIQRARDAEALAAADRRTAAIYLWGYAAEMVLKAAYFRLIGFAPERKIEISDLRLAARGASSVKVTWPAPHDLHNLRLWGELLVNTRLDRSVRQYPSTEFGSRVLFLSIQLQGDWRVTLRYHKNVANPHEVRRVREATNWLLENASQL